MAGLAPWTVFDDEALLAIADAFLPPKLQRRYTTKVLSQTQTTLDGSLSASALR